MTKRVLFVCVENSNRSQMAEAFARIHGGKEIEAYSAGSRPSGRVNPKAIDAMREIGYDLTAHHSKSLDDLPEGPFDAIVTGLRRRLSGRPLQTARGLADSRSP